MIAVHDLIARKKVMPTMTPGVKALGILWYLYVKVGFLLVFFMDVTLKTVQDNRLKALILIITTSSCHVV